MVAVVNSIDGTAVNVFRDFPFDVAGKPEHPRQDMKLPHHLMDCLFAMHPMINLK